MNYSINSTKDYHIKHMNTLGWELTVCNALYREDTPIRKILDRNDSFGHLLYDYLRVCLPMNNVKKVVEIGGGYGYLMKDFMDKNSAIESLMIDISPFLLKKQEEILSGYKVLLRQEDFLETDPDLLSGVDLAIMNENLGDFPTIVKISQKIFKATSTDLIDSHEKEVVNLFERYGFKKPFEGFFNFNMGAILAVEKLCSSGIPYIYIGEHSCEAQVPDMFKHFVSIESSGNPEKISLMGHNEYTIKFSFIEQVAKKHGYTSIRGNFIDFIKINVTEDLLFAMLSKGRLSDDGEMICQFVEDLFKYEYLILSKENG